MRPTNAKALVWRCAAEKIRAFYNVCSHRAHELLQGQGKVNSIVCPYHAWTYDLSGSLKSNPATKNLADFSVAEFCLKEVRLEQVHGFLFVNLDPKAKPIAEEYPGFVDEVRSYGSGGDKLVLAKRLNECELGLRIIPDFSSEISP